MKNLFCILLSLLFVFDINANNYSQTSSSPDKETTASVASKKAIIVTVDEVSDMMHENQVDAEDKYFNTLLTVVGKFDSVRKERGNYVLKLDHLNDGIFTSCIECTFQKENKNLLKGLKKGDVLSIDGFIINGNAWKIRMLADSLSKGDKRK